MKALVIGSGGREHAICWKLRGSAELKELYCAPGNPGTQEVAENIPIGVDDIEGLIKFAEDRRIDLTIVGPEYPLTLGLVDRFRQRGLRIFGPSRAAAQLEASKSFAKDVMKCAGVPTAAYKILEHEQAARAYAKQVGAPLVLKADGLAAGKGVFVCTTEQEIHHAIDVLFNEFKSSKVVAETFLAGKEVSFIVATDGERVVPLPLAHDYKRIGDGDTGLNTGGMGTVCPTPRLQSGEEKKLIALVINPVLEELKKRGCLFCGFLYAGLMVEASGAVHVLEYNARMGDPECQVIMRRLNTDLFKLLYALSADSKDEALPAVSASAQSAVCIVLASDGYPGDVKTGDSIHGVDDAGKISDVVVFHAGTKLHKDHDLMTSGGRVFGVTAIGSTLAAARAGAYRASELIQFRGKQSRRDIGAE